MIHGLVVESRADHIEGCHGHHHHHAADHAGGQPYQPAVLREHLSRTNGVRTTVHVLQRHACPGRSLTCVGDVGKGA